jgi:membrane-associated protease RseP (regulator of RpoE activity)
VPDGLEASPVGDSGFTRPRGAGWPRLWWVNLLLLLATLITTTVFGFALVESFSSGRPFDVDRLVDAWTRLARGDRAVWAGLDFSAPLLLILLAHEFGHYIVCAQRGIKASLPYFLPSPMLFGTFGAFIRIRTPIYTRKSLFDVGIAGPIAGFIVLLPFLIAGVSMSRVAGGIAGGGPFVFGTPLALRAAEWIRFPHAATADILLHPMAMAAWAGLLATAFNLLPMGQLDGGHILYAVFGQRGHRLISSSVVAVLALLGFLYWPWWFWGAVMFFLGRRHPLVYDGRPVSKSRMMLSAVALLLFLVSISVVPVRAN